MITKNLEELLLPYGLHVIRVKAKASGYDDSEFSNPVNYNSVPILEKIDKDTIRLRNCRAAATTYNFYNSSDVLIHTETYAGVDGGYVDIDVTDFGFIPKKNNLVYCKATIGAEEYQSATLKFYYGSAVILGVSGLTTSTTALTRTEQAEGLTWAMSNNVITSDFDDLYPYSEMVKETDSLGNVFVRVPEIYWKITHDASNVISAVTISNEPFEPVSGNTYIKSDAFLYGAYGGNVTSSKLQSKSGVARTYSVSRTNFRTYAKNQGTGYGLIDLMHTRILEFLWLIEFADKNSENIMWGYTSYGANCGATDTLTAPSGQLAAKGRMRWRYIEDFIGNGYEWFDGIYGLYVTDDYERYADSNIGTAGTGVSTSGYELQTLGFYNAANPLLCVPKAVINNSSYNTYFCDQVYYRSGSYGYYRGRSGASANVGLFCWYSNTPSYTGAYIGSRLMKHLS